MCSTGFCYCLLLLTPNYQWIQVEWSGAFSKHPKEATLWRELGKYVFSPSGAVRDKNPLWAWAVIFVTSAHAQPDVRNFLTSRNGCVQSPSFLYHVTKKRRAPGTRMNKFKFSIGRKLIEIFQRMKKTVSAVLTALVKSDVKSRNSILGFSENAIFFSWQYSRIFIQKEQSNCVPLISRQKN